MANPTDDKVQIFIESVVPSLTQEEIDRLLVAIQKRLDELETTDPEARSLRQSIRAARQHTSKAAGRNSIVGGIIQGIRQARRHE